MKENNLTINERRKIKKICEKALGISVENIFAYMEKNKTVILNRNLFYSIFEIDCYDEINFYWIKAMIDEYNFDMNTFFEIKAIYNDKNVKILKKGNYFECMYDFYINYPLYNIKNIFGLNDNENFEIRIMDNKNNFEEILFYNFNFLN